MRFPFSLVLCLSCTVPHAGLSGESPEDVGVEARDAGTDGSRDVGFDGAMEDAGVDAGPPDTGPPDIGPVDTGPSDAMRCSTGPDSDGDGVSDECDICAGDDTIDGDGDGVPDACDDWLCGTRPVLSATVMGERITVTNARLGGGGDATSTRTFAQGSAVRVRFNWHIRESDTCTGCIEQVEVGVSPGGRLACAYDGNPNPEANGSFDQTYTLEPADLGRIDVRFNLGLRYDCDDDGNVWWTDAPPDTQTFAVICVAP